MSKHVSAEPSREWMSTCDPGVIFKYKAKEQGIDVDQVDEYGMSKTCSACGTEEGSQHVERGLYVCELCGTVANADNGVENIREKVLPSLTPEGGEMDNGWMASRKSLIFDDSSKTLRVFETASSPPVRL